jgi:hypothetical protein
MNLKDFFKEKNELTEPCYYIDLIKMLSFKLKSNINNDLEM